MIKTKKDKLNNIVSQVFWDNLYENIEFKAVENSYFLLTWINKYLPSGEGDCIEIGCYPGHFLPFLGQKGYTVHGIDLAPGVEDKLPEWLGSSGIKTGFFQRISFEDFSPSKKYDVVCSFGFIEHFKNSEEIIIKHLSMIKPSGYIILETPNFRGIYWLLYKIFYNEDLKRHVLKAMKPKLWKKTCEENGFEILDYGYIGGFAFYFENPVMNKIQKIISSILKKIFPYISVLLPTESFFYSRACILIARKKD